MSVLTDLVNIQQKAAPPENKHQAFSDIFIKRQGVYLNEFALFQARFNSIPNFMHEIHISCKGANAWFLQNYRQEIKDLHFSRRYLDDDARAADLDDVFYFLYDDLIVNFDATQKIVRFLFRKTPLELIEQITSGIKKFKRKKQSRFPRITLLVGTSDGIIRKRMNIEKSKINLDDNYNIDFPEVHQIILRRLNKKNDKGIVMLHGKPGTGKTSYIRYLISKVKKDIIFLPPSLAGGITNPDLMAVLADNPNSIFVIEDAENIVFDRERDGHSPVSALLNVSDGLLADCLNIQIICTFNTDLSKVDNALMRKGRLIAKYEFKELSMEKATNLSKKLGIAADIEHSMNLTDIYNYHEKTFQTPGRKSAIGFIQNCN